MAKGKGARLPALFAVAVAVTRQLINSNQEDDTPLDPNLFFIFMPDGDMVVYRRAIDNESFITSFLKKVNGVNKKEMCPLYSNLLKGKNVECEIRNTKLRLHCIGFSYDFECPEKSKFEREPFTGDYYIYGIPEIRYSEMRKFRENRARASGENKNIKIELDAELAEKIREWMGADTVPFGSAAKLLKQVAKRIEEQTVNKPVRSVAQGD